MPHIKNLPTKLPWSQSMARMLLASCAFLLLSACIAEPIEPVPAPPPVAVAPGPPVYPPGCCYAYPEYPPYYYGYSYGYGYGPPPVAFGFAYGGGWRGGGHWR